jgi:class 3 adenylate cyclase
MDPMNLLDELTRPARWENLTILFADMRGFTQL